MPGKSREKKSSIQRTRKAHEGRRWGETGPRHNSMELIHTWTFLREPNGAKPGEEVTLPATEGSTEVLPLMGWHRCLNVTWGTGRPLLTKPPQETTKLPREHFAALVEVGWDLWRSPGPTLKPDHLQPPWRTTSGRVVRISKGWRLHRLTG